MGDTFCKCTFISNFSINAIIRGAKLLLFYPEEHYQTITGYFGLQQKNKRWMMSLSIEAFQEIKNDNMPLPNYTLMLPGTMAILGPKVYHQAINLQVMIMCFTTLQHDYHLH